MDIWGGWRMRISNFCKPWLAVVLAAMLCHEKSAIADDASLYAGQILYLPVYSHIWHGDRVFRDNSPLKTPVSVLVSIRNTNQKTPVRLISARYFNGEGRLLKQYVERPLTIKPLGTYELFVERHESEGGSGANFLLQWESVVPANAPVVEALHAEVKGHSTFTFITRAQPVMAEQ